MASWKRHGLPAALGGAAALSYGIAAFAPRAQAQEVRTVSPTVLAVAEGFTNNAMEGGGAGNEQPSVAYVEKDDKVYVVSVYMSSDVEQGFWQCKCSSVELTKEGPKYVADNVQLTFYEGAYRPCNHPRIASDGEHVLWTFASDRSDPLRTSTYAGVLDETCNVVIDPVGIGGSEDGDVGAPDVVYNGKDDLGDYSVFTAGFLSSADGGSTLAAGLVLGPNPDNGELELSRTYTRELVSPANIGRPTIASGGPDRSLVCAAKGNQRPPEIGIECHWIDALTGDIIQSATIAESDKQNNIFYNQPSVAPLDFGRFAILALESNGVGRKDSDKGANKAHLYIYDVSDNGFTLKKLRDEVPLTWPTHAALCTGKYGESGNRHMAIMGAPVTGVGQPRMQMVYWSAETDLLLETTSEWTTSEYGDAGHFANQYGPHPDEKGREFLRCIGDVPNPGYDPDADLDNPETFMPFAETLFVMPVAGQKPGQPKNAMFLSFIPGESDVKLAAGKIGSENTGPGAPEGPGQTPATGEQASGCSVSTDATAHSAGSGSSAPLGLAILGGALALAQRRRLAVVATTVSKKHASKKDEEV